MPTTARRFKQPQIVVNATELKSMQQAEPQNRLNDFDKRSDVRLPGMGLKFDWDKLQDIEADCRLIVLNDRQIAWLEDIIGRLTRAEYYKNPDYIAHLWGIDSAHGAWPDIQDFCEEVAVCLMLGCKVSELVGSLNDINTTLKYILATKTDGVVRDHLPDPARLDEFAAKIGVTVDDLPTSDLDTSWPELSRFDELGQNRKMIDEVPSVWISEGLATSKSMADMYAETMYYTPITDPTGTIAPVWVGFAETVTKNLERVDLALRHINAKFSRNGQVQLDLPEEPFTYNFLTGDRISIRSLIRSYLPSLVNLWPIKVYTSGGSIFTWGPLATDDPQKYDPDMSPAQTSWLNKSLHESMRSMATTETVLQAGLPLVGNTPAIPATPISAAIPSVPFYAGTTDIVWPGTYGLGLADMFKLPEKPKQYTGESLGLPYGVEIVGGKIFALLPGGVKFQVFPTLLMPKFSKLKGESITAVLDSAFRFLKPTAEELASEDEDEFAKAEVNQSIWNSISSLFSSKTPNIEKINFIDLFNQFFRLADDDPNLQSADIKTHAQILNALKMPDINQTLLDQLISLVNALEGGLGQSGDFAAIERVLTAIADNTACLVLTQQAINKVTGGVTPDCLPTTPDTSIPADCSDVAETYDYIIDVLDWLVWGIQTIGNSWLADIILTYLTKARWFIAALTAAGLLEPSPAEEVVTIPLALSAVLSYALEVMLDMGVDFARQAVDGLKANRNDIVSLLCDADEETYDDKVDNFTETIKDLFSEVEIQIKVDDLIKKFFKGTPETPSPVKGSLLKKIL